MKNKSMFFMIFFALVGLSLINGCTQDQTSSVPDQTEQVKGDEPEETELSGCDVFPDKLTVCEAFSCEFKHPFTGEMMERKIIGFKDGKCQYTEEMPNGGRMDCEYSESMRKAAAQYYKDLAAAESSGTSVKLDSETDGAKTTYTINGKEVENPLQEAMDTGVCTISGYN